MRLSEALTKLKNLKSQLARVEGYVEESAVYFEDATPEYVYAVESLNRSKLKTAVLELKTSIQLTNALTPVSWGAATKTLAHLILLNAEMRTELAHYAKMLALSTEETSRYTGSRTKEHIKKQFAVGFSKAQLRTDMENVEQQKEALEAVLANTNMITDLVE